MKFWKSFVSTFLIVAIFALLSFAFKMGPMDLVTAGKMFVFEHSTFLEERGDSWGGVVAMIAPFAVAFIILRIAIGRAVANW